MFIDETNRMVLAIRDPTPTSPANAFTVQGRTGIAEVLLVGGGGGGGDGSAAGGAGGAGAVVIGNITLMPGQYRVAVGHGGILNSGLGLDVDLLTSFTVAAPHCDASDATFCWYTPRGMLFLVAMFTAC